MKKILLSIILLSFFFCKAQKSKPSFVIKHDSITNELSLWKPKKRTPEVLKKIRLNSFYTISSNIGNITNNTLSYNWVDAAKNNHEILITAYHLDRPNDIQTKRIKVRKPTKLELSYKKNRGLAPGVSIPLYAKIHFDDNTTEFVHDLRNSIVSITSENCKITKDDIIIHPFADLSKKSVLVKASYLYDSTINQSIEIPINYRANQRFDFDGQKGYGGNHGSHGENISVYVNQKTDSLVNILIRSGKTEKHLITNLYKSKIQIDTNGGIGGRGTHGLDGERGRKSSDSKPAGKGHSGGHGGNGGDGGDGGHVQIYYSPSLLLVDIQKLLSVVNKGGRGGRKGYGGNGGRGGYSEDNEGVLDKILNMNGGEDGERGTDGDNGRNGKNGLPPSFSVLEKKEMDRLFGNLYTSASIVNHKK